MNLGSVRAPYESDWKTKEYRTPSSAEYALVDWIEGKLSVDPRCLAIDTKTLKEIALRSGMPNAEWWAAQWKSLNKGYVHAKNIRKRERTTVFHSIP